MHGPGSDEVKCPRQMPSDGHTVDSPCIVVSFTIAIAFAQTPGQPVKALRRIDPGLCEIAHQASTVNAACV